MAGRLTGAHLLGNDANCAMIRGLGLFRVMVEGRHQTRDKDRQGDQAREQSVFGAILDHLRLVMKNRPSSCQVASRR